MSNNKNQNIDTAKIKKDRTCDHCNRLIYHNHECCSFRTTTGDVKYLCMKCANLRYQIILATEGKETIDFENKRSWLYDFLTK